MAWKKGRKRIEEGIQGICVNKPGFYLAIHWTKHMLHMTVQKCKVQKHPKVIVSTTRTVKHDVPVVHVNSSQKAINRSLTMVCRLAPTVINFQALGMKKMTTGNPSFQIDVRFPKLVTPWAVHSCFEWLGFHGPEVEKALEATRQELLHSEKIVLWGTEPALGKSRP